MRLAILIWCLLCSLASAASLRWEAGLVDETHAAPTGYRIHWGESPGAYTVVDDVGLALQWQIPADRPSGYFAATAYNAFGASGYSNEAFYQATSPVYIGATVLTASRYQVGEGNLAELISENFDSGSPSDDFNGTTGVANYTGGDLQFSGEGFVLHKTTVGTGNKWMRFKLVNGSEDLFAALGDSAGNLYGWTLKITGGNFYINSRTLYNTYNSWVSDAALGINAGALTAGQYCGITFEISTHTIRFWSNVTAAAPDSVSSWDSEAAGGSSTAVTFVSNSNYVGFGCWTSSGSGTGAVDDFTAGDFSSGASAVPANRGNLGIMLGMSNSMWLDNDFLKPTGGN